MAQKQILILGGTGKTGRRVAERLAHLGYTQVRVASRRGTPAFDWEDQKTWDDVLQGVETVYVTFQPDLAIPSALETIRKFTSLANAHGVDKVILLSGRGEQEAQRCEEIVRKTAKKWTIIRASWFNQNFSEGIFLDAILAGQVALPRAETPEPFIDANDIADVVVQTIINSKHHGKVYELTGPRLLTLPQAIGEIARACGRDIQFQALTLVENTQLLKNLQFSQNDIWLANYLFEQVLDGRNATVTSDTEKILGRKATDFTEYVRTTAATGIWDLKADKGPTAR